MVDIGVTQVYEEFYENAFALKWASVKDRQIQQGLTSHQTQRSLSEMGFYGSNDPTDSVKALNEDRSYGLDFNPIRSTLDQLDGLFDIQSDQVSQEADFRRNYEHCERSPTTDCQSELSGETKVSEANCNQCCQQTTPCVIVQNKTDMDCSEI